MKHVLPKITPKQTLPRIISKTRPKRAPSFASLKDDIEDLDNFDINNGRNDEDNIYDDEAEPQEHGPNIDDQKDEQSDEQKIYGNFINEEDQHRRQRPLRRLSSDFSSSGSFDHEFFGDMNGFNQFSSDDDYNSLLDSIDNSSDLLRSSSGNKQSKQQTESSILTDPFDHPFESSNNEEESAHHSKMFIFRDDDNNYQGKNPKSIFRPQISQIKETKPKKSPHVFNSPMKSKYGDDQSETRKQFKKFGFSKFLDDSDDLGLAPHKRKQEKDVNMDKNDEFKSFGNKFLDSDLKYPVFEGEITHHTPQKRKHPMKDEDGNIIPPCRNMLEKEKLLKHKKKKT